MMFLLFVIAMLTPAYATACDLYIFLYNFIVLYVPTYIPPRTWKYINIFSNTFILYIQHTNLC